MGKKNKSMVLFHKFGSVYVTHIWFPQYLKTLQHTTLLLLVISFYFLFIYAYFFLVFHFYFLVFSFNILLSNLKLRKSFSFRFISFLKSCHSFHESKTFVCFPFYLWKFLCVFLFLDYECNFFIFWLITVCFFEQWLNV